MPDAPVTATQRAASTLDRYQHLETVIVAAAKIGRWSRRVTFEAPDADHPETGVIRVTDSRTGQFLDLIAKPHGLFVTVNETDSKGVQWLTGSPGRAYQQGQVLRIVRRAVEIWRKGHRPPDGNTTVEFLLSGEPTVQETRERSNPDAE